MDELDDRNGSLQRKKPPWLKLDIPVIQLTPDETAALKQVKKKFQTEPEGTRRVIWILKLLVLAQC